MTATRKEAIRRSRIDNLRKKINGNLAVGLKIDVKTLENNFCYEAGISKRTFKEYLEIAMHLENCELRNGIIKEKNGKEKLS